MPEEGASSWSLYDLALHVNTRSFVAEVELLPAGDLVATEGNLTPVLTRDRITREMFVANAVFQQKAEAPEVTLLMAIAAAAGQAGRTKEQVEMLVDAAKAKIAEEAETLKPFGLDIGLSELDRMRGMTEVVLNSGLVAGLPLEQSLRAYLTVWSQRLGTELSSDVFVPGNQDGPVMALARFNQTSIAQAHDLYQANVAAFRGAYDSTLASIVKATPGVAIDLLHPANPAFTSQPAVKEILTYIQENQDANGEVLLKGAAVAGARGLLNKSLGPLSPLVTQNVDALARGEFTKSEIADLAIAALGDAAGFDARRLAAASQSLKDGLTIGNAAAGVYVAQTIVGLFDKKLGEDIGRIGTVAVSVAQLVSTYNTNASLGTAAMGLGGAAMTGNVVAAIFSLSALAGGGQSSNDQAVLAELQVVRQQLMQVRQEMHERFDRIEKMLGTMFDQTMAQLNRIEHSIANLRDDVTAIRAELAAIDRRLTSLDIRLFDALEALFADLAELQLAPCVAWKDTTVTIDMSAKKFVECLSQLAYLATNVPGADHITSPPALNPSDIAARLARRDQSPLERLPYVFALAAAMNRPFVSAAQLSTVHRPAQWAAAATSYLRVSQTWPEYYKGTPLKQLSLIIKRGRLLQEGLTAAAQATTGGALLKDLLAKYDAQSNELEKLLNNARANYTDPHIKPGEKGSDKLAVCREGFFDYDIDNYKDFEAPVNLSTISEVARLAQRLGIGPVEWCMRSDNAVWGNNWGKTEFYEVALLLTVSTESHAQVIDSRILRTDEAVKFPTLYGVEGGIAGFWTDNPTYRNFITAQWSKLLVKLNKPQSTAASNGELNGELADSLRSMIARDLPNVAAAVKPKLSQALYERIDNDQTIVAKLGELETTTLLIDEFSRLAIPRQVQNNDVLHALLSGGTSLLKPSTVRDLRARQVDVGDLVALGKRRGTAAAGLINRAFEVNAVSTGAGGDQTIANVLDDLNDFLQHQLALCAAGERPVDACRLD